MPVLFGVAAVIGVLAFAISRRPPELRVERSTVVGAPPGAVFEHINDLHAWPEWSPWAKLDPEMQVTYDGAAAGVGAGYAWTGNKKVGEGRMTITESRPDERVALRLEFIKPFKSVSDTAFVLTPQGDGTRVTWTMRSKHDFMSKAMGVFMNMDQLIGKDFEKGLAQMKTVVEAERA